MAGGGRLLNASPSIEAQLRYLEEQLLLPEVRQSAKRVAALLADDFVEFGSSGRVFGKKRVLALLRNETPVKRSLSRFGAIALSESIVLVRYRATRRIGRGRSVRSLRSSIWRRTNGQWRMVFHQGTLTK
jgi:hypothetical protein